MPTYGLPLYLPELSHRTRCDLYCAPVTYPNLLPQRFPQMRTLVDLLNTEGGYARIVYELDSYGYQLHVYQPESMPDLFERMSGYATAAEACEAAQHQLSAIGKGRKAAKPRKRRNAAPVANRSQADGGSMGLL